jgi:hypothetical protein
VESRIELAEDLHNGNLNPYIKYSSLTALMMDAVGEATPHSTQQQEAETNGSNTTKEATPTMTMVEHCMR